MSTATTSTNASLSEEQLQELVIESDSGARHPRGFAAFILLGIALLWSLFQIWIASPLPYTEFATRVLHIPVLDATRSRFFHLFFAVFLAFLAYPARKKSPRDYVPALDWIFAIAGGFCSLYLYIFYNELARRSGLPTDMDIYVSAAGIVLLLEAARRTLGPPLVIVAVIFLAYTFFGDASFIPEIIQHKSQSLSQVANHMWLSTEGVFGIAIGVSTSFVFLFVLFGSLLEKGGAGNYFIQLSFSLLGHLRGGPAKAAVVSSALTGLVSGSSIANVVTTGTFTIPLMRRVGFSREQAGAVEVASSVNGQIMPPVMGAAAFLMVEYVGISYVDVVKHAFLPAIISYIALFYIVHLEAVKSNMRALPKNRKTSFLHSLLNFGIVVCSLIILSGIVYYGIGWIKTTFPEAASLIVGALFFAAYAALIKVAAHQEPLEIDNPNAPVVKLPETKPTFLKGMHFILPIVVLIWCLMVERLSPGLSAFWASISMVFILVTQRPLLSFFRKESGSQIVDGLKDGGIDLLDGLIIGARNMIAIGIATAAAGIIVGVVSLTGIGQVMTEVVEAISGGSFLLVLIFTALICLILGMGLPTTANYIVVASLMAKVIEHLGAQNGMDIPPIAIHLFVFYFGIMADVTPPVGLASFAAAAISGGDPIRTGLQGFIYSLRTIILPFLFIYNTDLLLVGIESWYGYVLIFLKATLAMLVFAAATQGWFVVRSKWYETILLLLIAFTMLRPGFWVDVIEPPYVAADANQLMPALQKLGQGESLEVTFEKSDHEGHLSTYSAFIVAQKAGETGEERLKDFGLTLKKEGRQWIVDDITMFSKAERAGVDFDNVIKSINIPQEQMDKRWMNIPAFILLIFVFSAQYNRKRFQEALESTQQKELVSNV